ncbi:hypothetical protein MK280_00805 [Myxococcota bacterium]|nr:hypothetical protein [Myxococcota bacterium]
MARTASRRTAAADVDPEPRESLEPVPADDVEADGPVGEIIRRVAAMGLSSFFTTETALRKAFGETVPKDWVDFANDQSERSRQEFFDRMASEMRKAVEQIDFAEILETLLTDRSIEIETKIRIHPRDTPASGTRPGKQKS